MHRKLASICALTLPVSFLAWACPALAEDQHDEHRDRDLLGSWNVTVTPTAVSVCGGPSMPISPPFTELAAYSAGGAFQENNTQLNWNLEPLFPGVLVNASDGFGTWKRRGPQIRLKFRKLVFDSTGHYIANADLSETVQQPENRKFSGKFTIQFSFFDGSPSICGWGDGAGGAHQSGRMTYAFVHVKSRPAGFSQTGGSLLEDKRHLRREVLLSQCLDIRSPEARRRRGATEYRLQAEEPTPPRDSS